MIMKLLLINSTANSGSTGRIAEAIGQTAILNGYESYFAYGRTGRESSSHLIRIGNRFEVYEHVLETRLFDNHGFSSRLATKAFINEIERVKPDVINLHNLHGYYLNVELLFEYLSSIDIPVVWTFHDCWPLTGHCSHFDGYCCTKWMTGCFHCPNKNGYPSSLIIDRSAANYKKKKSLFTSLKNLTIVTPSHWLKQLVMKSFLKAYPVITINNGVDLSIFNSYYNRIDSLNQLSIPTDRKIVLGVASEWGKSKGLDDFVKFGENLGSEYQIVLIGLNARQITHLPQNIIGLKRTESVKQLAELYSSADVFVNPTYLDNFPTTNIESLACGTPVITYRTGGSPEAIDENTGLVVEQGDIASLKKAIECVTQSKEPFIAACRNRAEKLFNAQDRYQDYVNLFNNLVR